MQKALSNAGGDKETEAELKKIETYLFATKAQFGFKGAPSIQHLRWWLCSNKTEAQQIDKSILKEVQQLADEIDRNSLPFVIYLNAFLQQFFHGMQYVFRFRCSMNIKQILKK
jgi:hypothetical protein